MKGGEMAWSSAPLDNNPVAHGYGEFFESRKSPVAVQFLANL